MAYKVHRLDINIEKDQLKLEHFLNELSGEVVSIVPHTPKISLLAIYGFNKTNFVLIIEKI